MIKPTNLVRLNVMGHVTSGPKDFVNQYVKVEDLGKEGVFLYSSPDRFPKTGRDTWLPNVREIEECFKEENWQIEWEEGG